MVEGEVSEAEGIKAIIDLQDFAGVIETEEQARAGWQAMDAGERAHTIRMHKLFCPHKC